MRRPCWILAVCLAGACAGNGTPAPDATPAPPSDAAPAAADASAPQDPADAAPAAGTPITDPATPGTGACRGHTLAEVIAAVNRGWPDLDDVTMVRDPAATEARFDWVRAFAHPDGFRLIFNRGEGDCNQCIDNGYWYFQTDGACMPVLVGTYEQIFSRMLGCLDVKGAPLWGIPRALHPQVICGADNRPADISGSYQVRARGKWVPCIQKGFKKALPVDLPLTVTVTQRSNDFGQGTATIEGTGDPRVDGVSMPATFLRRNLTAQDRVDDSSACIDTQSTWLDLDLEGGISGDLQISRGYDVNCPAKPEEFCTSNLDLTLGPP